ncbi:uncharacterized protein A1O5_10828 [Cladophialophora psammophila CBS 110553]|uniref:Origin recognition complex subunit 2 n=1 Tax=Cladophialophora psammophila CBS 110553 TaxID=1182543 RepID=W9WDM6_9EURO|nr:uncharacterized protein A1O5_10828 [Cladophialophora psammophila CBS 110553]EXJ66212.1 hypothetical protein A1O5_10828 [Cladophialophora psammophila CBS 110553]
MSKRKQPDPTPESFAEVTTPSKRRRKTTDAVEALPNRHDEGSSEETPSRRKRKSAVHGLQDEEDQDEGSPTPKPNGRSLFSTPTRAKGRPPAATPSKSARAKADRSAKRKSARLLAEAQDPDDDADDDNLDGQDARLAREILDQVEGQDEEDIDGGGLGQDVDELVPEGEEAATPSKKTPGKRGRPKGSKSRRSPTPEGDIPPEERYFYQNRLGPPQVSSNKFNSVKLLTHDEYFEHISSWRDPHDPEKAFLMRLHARSFPQWRFELAEGFGLCLYGYGSKQPLVKQFAEYMYKKRHHPPPRIVVVNGYLPKLNPRTILNTIASAAAETEDEAIRLVGQPEEMLDTLLSHLTDAPPPSQLLVMINSIDSPALRRPSVQSLLARLAAHPHISFLATCDTPTFPAMWNSTLLDQFKFVFHDCTTFAPYAAEIGSVVDDVHELLGRKRMRAGGKEGIGFVLKSLPENARNLYRLLLAEILSILDDDDDDDGGAGAEDDEDDEGDGEGDLQPSRKKSRGMTTTKPATLPTTTTTTTTTATPDEVGIEYRTLYRKAAEEFICSSSMNFQFLLKEFLDHQMMTTRRDPATGAEMLAVPLGRAEMLAVLEELV